MKTEFNPYHRWLAIPPHEQPPNHYRLLGLSLFETDPEVIQTAADRQMAVLRNAQIGPHGELAQKLLNEVSAARMCLIDRARRDDYNQQLRRHHNEQPVRSAPTTVAPRHATPAITPKYTTTVTAGKATAETRRGKEPAHAGGAPAPQLPSLDGADPLAVASPSYHAPYSTSYPAYPAWPSGYYAPSSPFERYKMPAMIAAVVALSLAVCVACFFVLIYASQHFGGPASPQSAQNNVATGDASPIVDADGNAADLDPAYDADGDWPPDTGGAADSDSDNAFDDSSTFDEESTDSTRDNGSVAIPPITESSAPLATVTTPVFEAEPAFVIEQRAALYAAESASSGRAIAFSHDGKRLATSGEGVIRIADVESGRPLRNLSGDLGYRVSLSWSPTQNVVAAAGSNAVCLWDDEGRRKVVEAALGRSYVDARFSSDGKRLLVAGSRFVDAWNLETERRVDSATPADIVRRIFVSSTDRVVVQTYRGLYLLGEPNLMPFLHNFSARVVAWSPDGKLLAVAGSDRELHLIDATTGRQIQSIGVESYLESCHFLPDNKTVVTLANNRLDFWEVSTNIRQHQMTLDVEVADFDISRDGTMLGVVCDNGTVSLWSIRSTAPETAPDGATGTEAPDFVPAPAPDSAERLDPFAPAAPDPISP